MKLINYSYIHKQLLLLKIFAQCIVEIFQIFLIPVWFSIFIYSFATFRWLVRSQKVALDHIYTTSIHLERMNELNVVKHRRCHLFSWMKIAYRFFLSFNFWMKVALRGDLYVGHDIIPVLGNNENGEICCLIFLIIILKTLIKCLNAKVFNFLTSDLK